MSDTFQCGDTTALVGFLYDECEPAERRAIDAHVAVCPACAAELAALGSTRLQIAAWTPPEATLGFRIVSEAPPSNVLRPARWWQQSLPAWAQAAAATLIFAAGLWLGIARGSAPVDDGVATVASAPAAATTSTSVSAVDLAALEGRLRTEMAQLRTATPQTAAGVPQTASDAQLLARVRALIEESEQRQQRELALRTAQVVRDFDIQRQVDLAQIQRTFGQMQGQTGAEVRDQREMLNYLMRVSQQR